MANKNQNDFEQVMVNSLKKFCKDHGIRAVVRRDIQAKYHHQDCDIKVDSGNERFYMGIECKSVHVGEKEKKIYFSQHFTTDNNGLHQVKRISDYLFCSGRRGYLAVELRFGKGKPRKAYLLPWYYVKQAYQEGKGILFTDIQRFPEMKRTNGYYILLNTMFMPEFYDTFIDSTSQTHYHSVIL